jgi:hypothetical protein
VPLRGYSITFIVIFLQKFCDYCRHESPSLVMLKYITYHFKGTYHLIPISMIIISIYLGRWACSFEVLNSFIRNDHPYVNQQWMHIRKFSKSLITLIFFVIFSYKLNTILLQKKLDFFLIKKILIILSLLHVRKRLKKRYFLLYINR